VEPNEKILMAGKSKDRQNIHSFQIMSILIGYNSIKLIPVSVINEYFSSS
jgi:hypothetical protein